jgi:hypothetical protein
MFNDPLNEKNYIQYAMKNYDNPSGGVAEFEEDMARIVYLKRLFRKYHNCGILRERLVLNHIITFFNVFGVEVATRLLFFRIEPELHYILKTFLVFLNYLPDGNPKFNIGIDLVPIQLDSKIVSMLRRI